MKPLQTTVFLILFSLAFTACGKKGELEPPREKTVAEITHSKGD